MIIPVWPLLNRKTQTFNIFILTKTSACAKISYFVESMEFDRINKSKTLVL